MITGACGLLGAHLVALFSRDHKVLGVDRHPWWGDVPLELLTADLESGATREAVTDFEPDVLIHCAALVDVDACEQDPQRAYRINADVTGRLAAATSGRCKFVYVTTDGIFKGDIPLRSETDLPCPRTTYGRSKLHGEWETEIATGNHVIVRTNFYGWSSGRKKTSAEWLFNALDQQEPITLFTDFYFTPIYVADLVLRIKALIDADARGIFHVCGGDRVSKFEFGASMAELAGLSMANVSKGSIETSGLRAARPKDMSLSSKRLSEIFGMDVPGCRAGLERFLGHRGVELGARVR